MISTPSNDTYDTIIIGAGMSGLAAGIRLAHFNQRVCILERHSVVGGLNSFYRQGGREFDVGLHAMTNYTPKGARRGPLARLLRQLRLAWDELALVPQVGSAVKFPGVSLEFSNDFELFETEVRKYFPRQIDKLRRLVANLIDYDDMGRAGSTTSAREVVSNYIDDPQLVDMLFCPVLFYGSAREHDTDFGQFSIMFRSIFLEGFARPLHGVRLILQKLRERFQQLGGELRLRCGVKQIAAKDGAVEKVVLDNGQEIQARQVVSSAGWPETMRLCDDEQVAASATPGRVSFVESISVLDKQPKQLGHDRTIVFFSHCDRFRYNSPDRLVDVNSGVICSPNNFAYHEPSGEGMIRITALADYDRWAALDKDRYRLAKLRAYDQIAASAARVVPDFRSSVVQTDMFTPTTIRRYTGRVNGAIYGAPRKHYDARTHLQNLFVCGTDQGMVGIVGAIISGITVANQYLLRM